MEQPPDPHLHPQPQLGGGGGGGGGGPGPGLVVPQPQQPQQQQHFNNVLLSGSGSFPTAAGQHHYFPQPSTPTPSGASSSASTSPSSATPPGLSAAMAFQSQPSSPFTPSSAPSSAASSPLPYPSAAGLGRAQLGEGGLTGSGEVVLGMEALAVGSQPDRGMSEEEKEKFVVNVMQELQKRRMVMEAIEWLRANYRVGTNGFTSKRDVFNHFMRVCKNKGVEPKISHTFFGKIVKRAFPNIKYNRKGPRGATQQCYTFLQRMTTDSDAASENINVSCMEEDESVLIKSNPLLPRGAAEEQERKEDSLGSSSSSLSTSPTSTASSPFTIPPGMQFAAAPPGAGQATLSAPISGSPGSSYVIFSLPQVAAPCPCSHCTNATALTSFSIPSISSSSLPPQIHSLPSISTLPSIPTLPSLLIQAAPGGGFQQTTTTATATTNSPTATTTTTTTTMSSSPSHQPLPGSTSTSTSPTKSVEETGSF